MNTLLASCEALERVSQALLERLAASDESGLDLAIARRAASFEALREASRRQRVGAPERAVLARIGQLDDKLRARARERQGAIQREREEIATSGRAVRALRASEREPRFVARHA